MESLQAVFPHMSVDVLRAVLEMTGDANTATNFLLSADPDEIELSLRTVQGPASSAPYVRHSRTCLACPSVNRIGLFRTCRTHHPRVHASFHGW